MTAIHAGATSHEMGDWHAIDWQQVNQNVRRLQARIVKATQEGKWGKVKALQHLLTHSYSGKALAVRRVTENHGKRTPGVDGETWDTPEKKATAVQTLKQRGYQPRPLRRVHIPKSNGKTRPLGIPTMKDRAMQALYLLALEPIAETTGDPNSYGFRSQRSTADAIAQCYTLLSRRTGPQWILEGDIKACFEGISHDWLLRNVPTDKTLLRKWLKAGYMENRALFPTEAGTPQGGIISPALANFALDGLEKKLREAFPKDNHKAVKDKVHFVRYADDFVITGSSNTVLLSEVQPLVEAFLRERGLELSKEKTSITHIDSGFDFLGQNVRKYNGTLLIMPSKKNTHSFLEKVRKVVKRNKQLTAGHLVMQLNSLIRGWAQYHQHVVSKDTFHAVDHAIFELLWRWAKRRHPNKSRRWIKAKYFKTIGGDNWVFYGEYEGREIYLFNATHTKITRHPKVKAEANPFDPTWEPYYEQRLNAKMVNTLKGRRQLLNLWKAQKGICPVCDQRITEITGWHNHHIIYRTYGGADTAENRVLLHPTCHAKVHNQNISVAKPRP